MTHLKITMHGHRNLMITHSFQIKSKSSFHTQSQHRKEGFLQHTPISSRHLSISNIPKSPKLFLGHKH